MRNEEGFSLVELLIVVACIGIIAALALPSLVQARRATTEASAINCLRSYTSAQAAFFATRGKHQYYATNTELSEGGFYDLDLLTAGERNNYQFTFTVSDDLKSYTGTANPDATTSGGRYYFVDTSGVIRFNATGPADGDDPAISGE